MGVDIAVIWFAIIVFATLMYIIMDGFDLGVASLLPFLAKNDMERRIIINSIGPTWEGNQVWFITGGGAIFAAWPLVYATAFSGFYWAMLAVLWALFFRPVGFDYRSKIAHPAWRWTKRNHRKMFLRDGDRILLQQRALTKYHTPGFWANTCCTHPHWGEAADVCALRRMAEELGITGITVTFREEVEYRADVGQGLTEHEVVQIFVADAPEGLTIRPNPAEVAAVERRGVVWRARTAAGAAAPSRRRPGMAGPASGATDGGLARHCDRFVRDRDRRSHSHPC